MNLLEHYTTTGIKHGYARVEDDNSIGYSPALATHFLTLNALRVQAIERNAGPNLGYMCPKYTELLRQRVEDTLEELAKVETPDADFATRYFTSVYYSTTYKTPLTQGAACVELAALIRRSLSFTAEFAYTYADRNPQNKGNKDRPRANL